MVQRALIILSLSHAGTAVSDTDGLCVVLSCGPLAAVKKFSVVLICRLLVVAIGGKGRLSATSDKHSADLSFGVRT